MPPPKTTDELLDRVRKSGLIPPADLDEAVAALPGGLSPKDVLNRFAAERLLTQFQADRLGVGKYKGFCLGSYVILDKIGGGGMGQVFLAEHAEMRRNVAIKVLPLAAMGSPVTRERFLREARAAAALDHPNIVRAFDLSREGQMYYLVMEYVEGVSLQALVARTGKVPVMAAADYGRQIAEGLHHAHERGLVHRDIKPANLLLDRLGGMRILDLGLVRSSDENSQLTNVTAGGRSILGTPDYLSPEQALDSSSVDRRADVYSLGATVYFLLAGHTMFPEGRTAQKLMWQQWKDPPPIDRVRPDVPAQLAEILHTALAKKPSDRFQTSAEFADALAGWATGPNPPDPDLIRPLPPRRFIRSTDHTADKPNGKRVRDSSASWAFNPSTAAPALTDTPPVVGLPAPRVTANGLGSNLPPVQWKRKAPEPAPPRKPSSSVDISLPPFEPVVPIPAAPAGPARLKQLFPNGNPLAPGKVIHLGPKDEEPAPPVVVREPHATEPGFSTALPERTGWSAAPAKSASRPAAPPRRSAKWLVLGVVALCLVCGAAAVLFTTLLPTW